MCAVCLLLLLFVPREDGYRTGSVKDSFGLLKITNPSIYIKNSGFVDNNTLNGTSIFTSTSNM